MKSRLTRSLFLALCAACALSLFGCQKANPLLGTWGGTVNLGATVPLPPGVPASMRLEFLFEKGKDGVTGSLKSLDQGNATIPFDTVEVNDRAVKLGISSMAASYDGKVDTAGTSMTGQWKQGGVSLPLTMKKQK